MKKHVILTFFILIIILACKQKDFQYTASVKEYKGKPVLYINDTITYPLIYSTVGEMGARLSYDEYPAWNIKRFADAGIRIFQGELWPAVIYDYKTRSFKKDLIAKQIRGFIDQCPNAAILLRLETQVNEWSKDNPDECVRYTDAPVAEFPEYGIQCPGEYDVLNLLAPSFASKKWADFAEAYLKQLIEIIHSMPEGKHVIGFHVCGGIYGEWHDWSSKFNPDCSKVMTNAFTLWLKNKYKTDDGLRKAWNNKSIDFEHVVVPGIAERKQIGLGIFRNPETQRNVIDYYECQHQVKIETIQRLCKSVKQTWRDGCIVGLFYGYFFNVFGRNAEFGHLRLDSLLNCPYIDYMAGPQSYNDFSRAMGGSGQSRSVSDALRLHGKLFLDENDTKSSLLRHSDKGVDSLIKADIAIVRRNIAQPFTHGTGSWFYDFGPQLKTGWWDHTYIMDDIKRSKVIFDSLYKMPFSRPSDVLFVYDPGVYTYTGFDAIDPVTRKAVEWSSNEAYKSGVVFDECILSDLPKLNLDQYKTVVFSNTYVIDSTMRSFIKSNVLKGNRHVVWNYMTGVIDGEKYDEKFVEYLTGFKLKHIDLKMKPVATSTGQMTENADESISDPVPVLVPEDKEADVIARFKENSYPAVSSIKNSNFTSWFCSIPLSDKRFMHYIFKQAGCHIYSDSYDVIHGGNNMLVFHTKNGGNKTITLKNGNKIEFTAKPKFTIYFDAESGKRLTMDNLPEIIYERELNLN
jgi:hypothetical protein